MTTIGWYFIGGLSSWYLMFLFMCWFGARTWPGLYKHDIKTQRKYDMFVTGCLACIWPAGIPTLLFVSLIWSFKK